VSSPASIDVCELGAVAALGVVLPTMLAPANRTPRFGDPRDAFTLEAPQ
jgi:hypothetical protein